ncbi:MAG TPA: SGNH/GDSL hydrolase family protein [Pyrinomonadaceae bacterium]|nr:SGNH/GDSL hydrolase family protein [Pyrinomonadaceae bacterium]
MSHIVLLGDSIFDNKSYVGAGGKDVVTHLREMLPNNSQATLNAIDGSIIENVSSQLLGIPKDATHLVVSVGGNNALMNTDVLQMPANSAAQVLNEISVRCGSFERNYSEMLKQVLSLNLPTAVCTIYFPNFPEPTIQKIAVTALSVFNDAIIRQAILNNLPILDLRLICNEKDDYANEIEPSDKGGRKIAAKILDLIENHNFSQRRTEIFI